MLADTFEVDEDDEIEEEADAEVDKVLFDLTNGKLGQVGSVETGLPVSLKTFEWVAIHISLPVESLQDQLEEEEAEREMEKYREQLNGLLSG